MFLAICLQCNNNPYESSATTGRVFFTSLDENPTTVDPHRVSDVDSQYIASNIHDTAYEFHYLKRPFEIIPSMATAMPERGWRRDFPGLGGRRVYALRFSLRPGLRFNDDVCFSDSRGRGREIRVDDMILAFKRAADDRIEPFGKTFLMDKLIGFREYHEQLMAAVAATAAGEEAGQDLEGNARGAPNIAAAFARPIQGIHRVDDYTLELAYYAPYPQSLFFLTNVTSAPVPAECLAYYNGGERGTYDRKAVASGPFYLEEWQDHHRLILAKNPNYRPDDLYPATGDSGDTSAGLLAAAGRPMPLLDEVRLRIIKRGPPRWALFEQGYLDLYRNRLDLQERLMQSPRLLASYSTRGVQKSREVELSVFGWTFNLEDPLFKKNLALRRAISLAIDREEFIQLFLPGRAIPAHGPVPPGLEGHDPEFRGPYSRYDPEAARGLLIQAGYPGGIDPKTGKALEIRLFDRAAQGRAAIYRYYIDQFAKIGLRLIVDEMDFPSLIAKMHAKDFQLIHWGWGADYPDPENFLQLLYGPNSETTYNDGSYRNADYDELYRRIARMVSGPERERLIRRMLEILAQDLPKTFLFHRESHYFTQAWTAPLKPNPMDYREMKYWDVDPAGREKAIDEWNRVGWRGYVLLAALAFAVAALIAFSWRQFRARVAATIEKS
ncbi:MAG: ABC transporter substrate-binding protein [Leptospirales bacterium]